MQWLKKSKESIIGTYLEGGQGNLSGTIVTSLMIDCPTYEEQKKIGECFNVLDFLITLHQRNCEELKRQKMGFFKRCSRSSERFFRALDFPDLLPFENSVGLVRCVKLDQAWAFWMPSNETLLARRFSKSPT